ncbi:MAG TPA: KH domain-containing protein [Kiritimatiellia bacterium]|nr:KH domain-containing protein [Kiritimatiellia bacterium]
MSYQSYVRAVLNDFVDHPQDIKLTELAGEKSVIIELHCHPDDVGKVIGKNGKVISALRTLLGMVGSRNGVRATIEVVE